MPQPTTLPPSPRFELVSHLGCGVWTAVEARHDGPERFLARRTGSCASLTMDKLAQAQAVSRILRHDNLVSLVGRIRNPPVRGADRHHPRAAGEFLVWDHCDAANLGALFQSHPCPPSPVSYLPESLCWHVLKALTRAVTYLHDGRRLVFDPRRQPKWLPADRCWSPILHRAIEPHNIFFQQPRGNATYGLCKLGDFSNAAVTGHLLGSRQDGQETWPCSVAATTQRGWEPLENTRPKIAQDPEQWSAYKMPYTLSDELWSIGSVLFTMMTGLPLSTACPSYGCSHVTKCDEGGCLQAAVDDNAACDCILGGCHHVPAEPCTHDVSDWKRGRHPRCQEPVVNIDTHLTLVRYSCWLRSAVRSLLEFDPRNKLVTTEALPFAEIVQEGFRLWREKTASGRDYVDADDEIIQI